MLGLDDTVNILYEALVKTTQNIKDKNQKIDDNLIHQRSSTCSCTSWTPLPSTRLFRSSGKNNKLSS